MSRRGEAVYEERDYYAREERGPPSARVQVRERNFEESDLISRRGAPERGSRPDFLRDDYGRGNAGEMVLRARETETFTRPRPRSLSPAPPVRDVRIRERIVERPPSPPPTVRQEIRTRVVERRSPSPPPTERLRARVVETRERVRERSPSPVIRERIIERVRERTPSPPPVRIRERIVERERERERERTPSPHIDRVRIRNFERETARAPSPSPSPSPPPPPPIIQAPSIHQEIVTHHRHIDHGFERARVPTPPPPPRREPARTKETDIDIYTSRNNTEVDITQKTTRSRTPAPKLTRRDTFYDDTVLYEQERDKLRVQDTRLSLTRRRSLSARPERRERERVSIDIREGGGHADHARSTTGIGRDEEEADYYERKVQERAYIGEAFNGATKDWAIVDVPPGTERVKLEGVGGGSQEITWQKYNGVRRSKFNPERERERERSERVEIRQETREELPPPRPKSTGLDMQIEISSSRRREGGAREYEREYERIEETSSREVGFPRAPPKKRMGDLWTEITKDLVVREAIEEFGYDFEETEYFYYIIQYLRYEDVLELVKLSETIRHERQHRLREIERERERMERRDRERDEWERHERRRERDHGFTDERVIEREVIYDSHGRPRRGGW